MPENKKKLTIPMSQKLIVGGVAGVVGTSCIFPLDTIKTRLQAAGQPGSKLKYSSPLDCARKVHAEAGIRGFYRGLGANLTGVTPEKAIKIAVNERVREMLEAPDGSIQLYQEVFAGGTAGFLQVVATNPMEIVKLRMQMQATLPAAERKGTMEVVKSLGLRGMYRGTPATWCRDVPYSMVFFPTYSNARAYLADENGECSIVKNLMSGTIAGACSAGLMTPMDVIKTRFQQQGGKELYGTMPNVAIQTWKNEGLLAFYKGAIPRMVTQGPLFGIALAAYELQKWYVIAYGNPDQGGQ